MYPTIKRLIDVVLASVALVLLSPLLIPVCLALLCTGEHKVFYRQERLGYRNRRFGLWKFATMLQNSPNLPGGLHTIRNDPRVLPFGNVLRKTKINELPQLLNVLRGHMSIVGPRPLVETTFAPFPEHVKDGIYNVRPGLTGIGSIVFRDEERLFSETSHPPADFYARYIAPAKGELELWYQRKVSLTTDVKIIILTIWVILRPSSNIVWFLFSDLPRIDVPGLHTRATR